MKKSLILILVPLAILLLILFTSCTKEMPLPAPRKAPALTAQIHLFNYTADTVRAEIWRYNSGGTLPEFYPLASGADTVVRVPAGKFVIGVQYKDTRRDYGVNVEIDSAQCFYYFIQ